MRLLSTLLLAGVALFASAAHAVGFEPIRLELDRGRHAVGGIWYPSPSPAAKTLIGPYAVQVALRGSVAAGKLPLVVMSHGTGGTFAGHVDTAMALADAGFVVAALSHPADNADDASGFGTPAQFVDRVHDLSRLIDYVTVSWSGAGHVDRERIGAFGFSAGGYTVLTAFGGRPDFGRLVEHCQKSAEDPVCGPLMTRWKSMLDTAAPMADARVRAIVAAAPGLGGLMDMDSLRPRAADIQLWRAENDEVLSHPFHVQAIADGLGRGLDSQLVKTAGHYAFLAPCPEPLLKAVPGICRDASSFDRASFHQRFNSDVTRFFEQRLRKQN